MSDEVTEMAEAGAAMIGLIQQAKEDGIDESEYESLMGRGLNQEQKAVAERYVGESRMKLEDDAVTIPSTIDQLADGKKKPWMFRLDGVWFVVKAKYGEGSYPHSKWDWRESGYKFIFYKAKRDDCVHNISILDADEY